MLFQDWGNGLATYPGFSTATVRQQCQRQCQRPREPTGADARPGREGARIPAPTSARARPSSALGAGGRRLAPLAALGRRSGESGRPD
jgi:hypothetical protein